LGVDGVERLESSVPALKFCEVFVALSDYGKGAVHYCVDLDATSICDVDEGGGHEVQEALHDELEVDAGLFDGGKDGGHGLDARCAVIFHVLMSCQRSGVQK